ncbi:MAG: flagellar hook assembly protein FlgD [Rhodobacteraceae bacterium]|nr:flagellar hook assembly protein FlgD [Paracoccaceae bacterium]
MDIQPATANSPAAPRQADADATKITSDYSTFLRMLTTQLQNQDPLNPIESSDYAVQLATFSGVEQQTRTNQLLEALATQFNMLGMAQMAGWVGQEARVDAPVWMDGDPVTLSPNPATGADRAVLVVKDSRGTVVARQDLAPSTEPYLWTGLGIDGLPLRSGQYTLSLESYRNDEMISLTPMEHYARIVEAQGGATGTTLLLEGGVRVAADKITALRGG